MKRRTHNIGLIIVLMLVIIFGAMPVASAEGEIDLDASVYPTQVLGAGKVALSVTIVATGGDNLDGVELYKNGKLLESYGTITAGQYKKYAKEVSIAASEIGSNKVVIIVKYTFGGEAKQVVKTLSVQLKTPSHTIDYSFWADREIIPEGKRIGLRFKFVNTGTISITGLRVRDSNIANNAWLNNAINIAPGETRIVTYNLTLNKDMTISPIAEYSAGGNSYTINFASKSLRTVRDKVAMDLAASTTNPAAGEEVEFTLRMKNTGNVFLQKITLYNHNNEIIKLPGSQLRFGEAFSIKTTAIFRESRSVQFDIIAQDSEGSIYSYASNTIDISVPINFNNEDLTITAEPEFTNLAKSGLATFDILLNNASEYSLYDISVIDIGSDETVAVISNMEKGERLLRIKTQVDESRDITFRVEAHDADGDLHTSDTALVPVAITVLGQATEEQALQEDKTDATPTPSATPLPAGALGKVSTWALVLIILGVLTLGVIIAISALIAQEKQRQDGGGSGSASPVVPSVNAEPKQSLKGAYVPKKRPGGPKKKHSKKKRSGPIRVSYRDKNNF